MVTFSGTLSLTVFLESEEASPVGGSTSAGEPAMIGLCVDIFLIVRQVQDCDDSRLRKELRMVLTQDLLLHIPILDTHKKRKGRASTGRRQVTISQAHSSATMHAWFRGKRKHMDVSYRSSKGADTIDRMPRETARSRKCRVNALLLTSWVSCMEEVWLGDGRQALPYILPVWHLCYAILSKLAPFACACTKLD